MRLRNVPTLQLGKEVARIVNIAPLQFGKEVVDLHGNEG